MKIASGIFFLCLGLMFLTSKNNSNITVVIYGIALLCLGILLCYAAYYKKNKLSKEQFLSEQKKSEQKKSEQRKATEIKLANVDQLAIQLSEVQKIPIIEISDFKKIIVDNEKSIVDKGGDNQLFTFIKIDSFLRDFRERIVNDQTELNNILDVNWLKSRITEETQRTDLEKIFENLNDASARLEGNKTKGFDSNVEKLFGLGKVMKPVVENQIKILDYYRNIAVAMIAFYLSDKKIRYYEVYEAFEKLGVFDSTWQKNVLNKLDNIESRLTQISNQLTELNQNFISLIESSENIVFELKEINNGIMTSNMLQAINTYQTWKINKNTSLRN